MASSLRRVEEARVVIARLDRIEAMERAREPVEFVFGQLELLALEAERWLVSEQMAGAAARNALEHCLQALERTPALESPLAKEPRFADRSEHAFDSLKAI